MICGLILIGFYLRNISLLKNPAIMLDEIGYWSSAAYFKGYNWSGVIGNFAAYYSYGYGFLLYLFMSMAKEPEIIHQIAICANVLMVFASFLIAVKVMDFFYPDDSFFVKIIACFASFFYPSVQYHTQVAWSETYLMFMFICSVYVAIKLYRNPKITTHSIFVLIIFNMYIIHMRSVGIVVVGTLYMLWIDIVHKKHIWKWGISILVLSVLLYGGAEIKNLLYKNVFVDTLSIPVGEVTSSVARNTNDYAGQIWKIKYLFTLEGIYDFGISFLGKIWYFGVASFFLGFDGLVKLIGIIKHKLEAHQLHSPEIAICIYMLASYAVTALVSTVAMIPSSRWDGVAYGRYTDFLGILIIAIGAIHLYHKRAVSKGKELLWYVIVSIVFLVVFWQFAQIYKISGFFASCSQIMLYFHELNEETFIIIMTLSVIAVGILIRVIMKMKVHLAWTMAIVMWSVFTRPSVEQLIELERPNWIYPVIEYIKENQYENIYYFYSEDGTVSENFYSGGIQYMLMDRPLYCIKDINEIKLDNPCIIVGWSPQIPDGYSVVIDFGFYRIMRED